VSPAYEWHRAHGAVFGEKAGWERVDYYASNAAAGPATPRPHGWAGRDFSPALGAEHLAARTGAALFDESSFAKIEVSGPGAAELLEWLCDNRVARGVGSVTYTQALNSRGGIESDFTVTRLAEDEFVVVTSTALGTHDLGWLRRHARGSGVRLRDVSGGYTCYALWGPDSRRILAGLTPADLGNAAFPFMTMRETTVADVPVRAQRVTFVGELGWELYAPAEYGAALWRSLWEAGRPAGLLAAGYRAIESLRLEKGYRVWGTDITAGDTPYQAGLGFCVKLDKPGGFLGRDALLRARDAGPDRVLTCLVLDDPRAVVLGNEPVSLDGRVAGRVTSGGFGYTVGASLAYAYLPADRVGPGVPVSVSMFGRPVGASVSATPLVDPEGRRVRA
jgi:4-methylaminobutanoate oxidase (formaldehyde-forming)